MNNVFDAIQISAKALKIDAYATDVAVFAEEKEFSKDQLEAIAELLGHLKDRRDETIVNTLLKMSRLPLKEPKTFQGFDFGYIRSKDALDKLKSLSSLATLHASRNYFYINLCITKAHICFQSLSHLIYYDIYYVVCCDII